VFCVGLTGNIATGKSTVAKEFNRHGADIINADDIAKKITEKGSDAFKKIIEHFNHSIQNEDGTLNRKKLRRIIFNQPQEKLWLENLLHPLIRKKILQKINESKANYIIIEIPLHFRREDYPYIDRVLLITSPELIQIQRIIKRDECDLEHAKAMINKQPDLQTRLTIADDVIHNDGNLENLKQKVKDLHLKYLNFIEHN